MCTMKVYGVYLHRIPLLARECSGVYVLLSRRRVDALIANNLGLKRK